MQLFPLSDEWRAFYNRVARLLQLYHDSDCVYRDENSTPSQGIFNLIVMCFGYVFNIYIFSLTFLEYNQLYDLTKKSDKIFFCRKKKRTFVDHFTH